MAELKDSGARREFGTGAVRDVADGKGRCDLLPLAIVGGLLQDENHTDAYVFRLIDAYMRTGEVEHLDRMLRCFVKDHYDSAETAVLELAQHFEDGARKYSDRNWESGIPLHCFIDSGVRHYLKFRRGDTDEPHGRAFMWNIVCAIWTQAHHPELIDLPFAEEKEEDEEDV